jgi:hypothetical protein
MAKVSRNDACPCGSGQKHKNCCLGQPPKAVQAKKKWLVWLGLSLSLLVGTVMWRFFSVRHGVVCGLAALVLVGVLVLFQSPPPSRGRQGADRIGFGR